MRRNQSPKKPAVFAPDIARYLASTISKQAILDIAWNACVLGTNETQDEILTKFCREAEIVLRERGDRMHHQIPMIAARRIEADGDYDWKSPEG